MKKKAVNGPTRVDRLRVPFQPLYLHGFMNAHLASRGEIGDCDLVLAASGSASTQKTERPREKIKRHQGTLGVPHLEIANFRDCHISEHFPPYSLSEGDAEPMKKCGLVEWSLFAVRMTCKMFSTSRSSSFESIVVAVFRIRGGQE